jgi:hypothetical protein
VANPRKAKPEPPPPDYVLGLDLGQARDYSALAVLERRRLPEKEHLESLENHFAVRHLKRWTLGTSYTAIVAEVAELVGKPPLSNPMVAVDKTGVGSAVVEMFTAARMKANLRPILITSGFQVLYGDDGAWHVPKKELVSVLQVLLQSRRLKVASSLEHAATLTKELQAFRVKVTVAANETFEAWRERDHDDMVLAVAMACWLGETQGNTGGMTVITPEPRPNPWGSVRSLSPWG